jgi:hypothetical protein
MRRALAAAITLASTAALVSGITLTAARASQHATGHPAAARSAAGPSAARAAAVAPRAARHEEFRIISTAAAARRLSVLATGGFTAGGYVVPGTVVSLHSADKLVFRNGGFQMARHITRQWLPMPTSACLVRETIHGKFTLGHGTGAFSGISGSGSFVMKIRGVLRRPHGKCGGPMTVYQMITWAGGRVRR